MSPMEPIRGIQDSKESKESLDFACLIYCCSVYAPFKVLTLLMPVTQPQLSRALNLSRRDLEVTVLGWPLLCFPWGSTSVPPCWCWLEVYQDPAPSSPPDLVFSRELGSHDDVRPSDLETAEGLDLLILVILQDFPATLTSHWSEIGRSLFVSGSPDVLVGRSCFALTSASVVSEAAQVTEGLDLFQGISKRTYIEKSSWFRLQFERLTCFNDLFFAV